MGDSVTYGIHLPESLAWPARLQAKLNEAFEDKTFTVFNIGVPGYGGVHCKRLLQSRYMVLEPDMVLWAESPFIGDSVELPDSFRSDGTSGIAAKLYRSRFLYLLWIFHSSDFGKGIENIGSAQSYRDMPPYRTNKPFYGSVYGEFVKWCRERGVELFLGVEYLEYKNSGGPKALYGNSSVWMENKHGFIETLPAFRQFDGDESGLFLDLVHLSDSGSELYAHIVFNTLKQNKSFKQLVSR